MDRKHSLQFLHRRAVVMLLIAIGCRANRGPRDRDTAGVAARAPTGMDSASALRVGQRALVPLPWADSLLVKRYTATDSGYEFALELPEPKDPNIYNLAGGVVFVRRDGAIRILEHYR